MKIGQLSTMLNSTGKERGPNPRLINGTEPRDTLYKKVSDSFIGLDRKFTAIIAQEFALQNITSLRLSSNSLSKFLLP